MKRYRFNPRKLGRNLFASLLLLLCPCATAYLLLECAKGAYNMICA